MASLPRMGREARAGSSSSPTPTRCGGTGPSTRHGNAYRVVPLIDAKLLDERLSNGKLVVEAGHFVWEERADEYAYLIADWVADGVPRRRHVGNRGRDVTSNRRRQR